MLNGPWEFAADPEGIGRARKWARNLPDHARATVVPGCWNHEPGFEDYRGIVWYQSQFTTWGPRVAIYIHDRRSPRSVYVDGEPVADQLDAASMDQPIVTELRPGVHSLVIETEGRHSSFGASSPLGGIRGPVEVVEVGNTWIRDVRVRTDADDGDRNIGLTIRLQPPSPRSARTRLVVSIDGRAVWDQAVIATARTPIQIAPIRADDLPLWELDAPVLATLEVRTDDDLVTLPIAHRTIRREGPGVILNGRRILIRAVHYRPYHPDWGDALPFPLIQRDIGMIRDLDFNAICLPFEDAGAATLDLCDSLGILALLDQPNPAIPRLLKPAVGTPSNTIESTDSTYHGPLHPSQVAASELPAADPFASPRSSPPLDIVDLQRTTPTNSVAAHYDPGYLVEDAILAAVHHSCAGYRVDGFLPPSRERPSTLAQAASSVVDHYRNRTSITDAVRRANGLCRCRCLTP